MGLYSNIRLLEHSDTVKVILAGDGAACPPLHVRIEPSEVCNFRCQFCVWHDPERHQAIESRVDMTGKRQLPRERLLRLIDEFATLGIKAISFTGAGDPLVYPHMAEVLRRIREAGIKSGVTSNLAMPLKDETIQELAHCSWVRWSMNGGTEDVYMRVHRPRGNRAGESFVTSQENVKRILLEMRDRSRLNASFVVHESNAMDAAPAAALAAGLGVSSIAFRPDTPFDREAAPLSYVGQTLHDILRAKRDYDSATFQVHVNEDRLEDVRKLGDPDLVCFYSNHSTYIAANGDVYPCCYTRYDKRYVMGNILDRDFSEFWNDPLRRGFYRGLSYDACPSCPHGKTNQILKSLYKSEIPIGLTVDSRPAPDPFV
jgi:radical SAM protein with 4Fe4S-binding SPASM domain